MSATEIATDPRPLARALGLQELEASLRPHLKPKEGSPAMLARRLHRALFRGHAMGVGEIEAADRLSRPNRAALDRALRVEPLLAIEKVVHSSYDRSFRAVLRLRPERGGDLVEAVGIPRRDELTLCISSQAGCPLACAFCATGLLGFRRNLTAAEIVEQHAHAERIAGLRVDSIVFMGMGEPLLNYDEVIAAARRFTAAAGAQISYKRIVLSTAGVVPQIRRYVRERHPFPLYFSLTSAIPEKRRRLMPIEDLYPLPELVEAIREYVATRRWNPRATLEVVAIPGENMGAEDADAIAERFRGVPVIINVIPYNATDGRFRPPTWAEVKRFTTRFLRLGLPVKVRFSSGKKTGGGCGQLAAGLLGEPVLEGHHLSPPGIFSDRPAV